MFFPFFIIKNQIFVSQSYKTYSTANVFSPIFAVKRMPQNFIIAYYWLKMKKDKA